MASSVFYKFASQKTESRVTFDGTGISVFDLKKDIILANNLGKANDFDLFVYDSSNQGLFISPSIKNPPFLSCLAEYKDDSQIIPRSSAVVVKRRPAVRPGKGKAAMYIAGAPAAPVSSASNTEKPVASVNLTNNSWHRPGLAPPALSKRFDRDGQSEKFQVRCKYLDRAHDQTFP
jgi:protein MPE1